MRTIYTALKKLKLVYELFTKMPYVPLKDVFRNVIKQEKKRQKLNKILEKELER